MKKLALTIFILFLLGIINYNCTKQSSCENYDTNYSEGILITYEKPYYSDAHHGKKIHARFYPNSSYDSDFSDDGGIGIVSGLPNKYKKIDTIKVAIGFESVGTVQTLNALWGIKCIEEID